MARLDGEILKYMDFVWFGYGFMELIFSRGHWSRFFSTQFWTRVRLCLCGADNFCSSICRSDFALDLIVVFKSVGVSGLTLKYSCSQEATT